MTLLTIVLISLIGINQRDDLVVEGYRNGIPEPIVVQSIPAKSAIDGSAVLLQASAAKSFSALVAHANKDGFAIHLTYGFRTQAEQKKLYKRHRKRPGRAAPAGYSLHQAGLSVDIIGTLKTFNLRRLSSDQRGELNHLRTLGGCVESERRAVCKTELFFWLKAHAKKYHFYGDVSYEPWHWTYILGVEAENNQLGIAKFQGDSLLSSKIASYCNEV